MANQFIAFDAQAVTGWYDNSTRPRYQNLPPTASAIPAGFMAVTPTQWTAHLADLLASNWTVVNGVLNYKGSPIA